MFCRIQNKDTNIDIEEHEAMGFYQGCSNYCGWSGFGRTTFLATINLVLNNIYQLKFQGMGL